jgi:hypothetical protein
MKNLALQNVIYSGAAIASSFLMASCASVPSGDRPANVAANSSWTYERRDSGSFGKGTAYATTRALGERTWQGRKVLATETAQGIRLTDPDKGDWLAMVKGDTTLLTWEPSLGYDWPLAVGKSFNRNYRFVNHVTKQTTEVRSTMTVQALEDVTVPAGTFKAFRIHYADSLGAESTNWFSPDAVAWVKIQNKRDAKHPAGAGTQDLEMLSYTIKR